MFIQAAPFTSPSPPLAKSMHIFGKSKTLVSLQLRRSKWFTNKTERFSFSSCTDTNNSDSVVHSALYKPISGCLEQIADHKDVKQKVGEKLEKVCSSDVQLPANLKTDRPVFLEITETSDIMGNEHLSRIDMSGHRVDLLNDEVTPVHFSLSQARQTERQFAAAEMNRMLGEKLIEPVTT